MIGFVSDHFHPSIGGTQVLCKAVAEYFHNRGHEIGIITGPENQRKRSDYSYKIDEINNMEFANNGSYFLENNYDAIFVFADLASISLITIPTSYITKTILILNLDENVFKWVEEGRFLDLEKRLEKINKFDHVVSFCQGAPVNKFLEKYKINYHFIPNFSRDVLKTKKIDFSIRKHFSIPKDKKIIFNHGLIESRKNQLFLIQKFHEAGLKDDYSLIFLGNIRSPRDRQYLEKCQKYIKDKNLDSSVIFIKGTNKVELIDSLLCQSDLFILPSTAEGLPLVLIEAMSAGLPWVSTPVGGVPKVMGDLKGGVVLEKVNFSSQELKQALLEIENKKTSREEWEERFTKENSCLKYKKLLLQDSKFLKTMVSFACPAFNEEKTIGRFLKSSLQFKNIVDEVVIINHRSADKTQEIIDSFLDEYKKNGVKLVSIYEDRDFSTDFSLADLRQSALQACTNNIVFMHDADFVFGDSFRKIIKDSLCLLRSDEIYCTQYGIPVLNENVCKMHVPVPRVFKKEKTQYRQDHVSGKHEWAHPIDPNCTLIGNIPVPKNSLLSINTKTEEAKELRRTMTTYFEDIYSGKVTGSWFKSYDDGLLRKEKCFFDRVLEKNNLSIVDIDVEEFIK